MEVGDCIVVEVNGREIVAEVSESNKYLLGCLNQHRSATVREAGIVLNTNEKIVEL